MKRLLPVLLIITLLLFSCGNSNTGASGSEPTNSGTNSDTESTTEAVETSNADIKGAKEDIYIGELVESDSLVMCINSVVEGSGDGFFTPEEGNKFVNLDVTIHNTGSFAASSSSICFTLVDSAGTKYESSWAAPTHGSLDGTIKPGRVLRGEVAYEIPQDVNASELLFDYDLSEVHVVKFKLDADKAVEPTAFTNPKEFTEAFKLGDTVTADNYTYVVNGIRTSTGSDYMSPDEGNIYYVVSLAITNTSSEPQAVSGLFMFELQDEFGYTYDTAMFTEEAEDIDVELEAQATIEGEIVFEVSESLTNFKLLISPAIFSDEQYVVEMQ